MTGNLSVLISADAFLPGSRAGGPIRALVGLIQAEASSADLRVVTSNRDHGAQAPYAGISHDSRTCHEGLANVTYVDTHRVFSSLAIAVRTAQHDKPDVLYLNSLFSPIFSIALATLWRLSIIKADVLLIAPRGELGAAARRIKAWKKRPVGFFMKSLLRSNRVFWHATSSEEASSIGMFSGADRDHVIQSSDPWTTPVPAVAARSAHPFTIAFVARIVPIKGLDIALKSLILCKPNVDFHIVGAPEDRDYWHKCQELMALLPSSVRVRVHGHLESAGVASVLSTVDALVLPTAGENFCHSIAEALASGVICIVPPTTPWTDIIMEATSSVVARDAETFAAIISRIASSDVSAIEGHRSQTLAVYTREWREHQALAGSLFETVANRAKTQQV